MTQMAPSAAVLRKPYGCMVADTATGELTLDVRLSQWDSGSIPRSCDVELRIAAWDALPVFAIALLLRLGRNPTSTFQAWINAGDTDDHVVLKHLSSKNDILIRLVDQDVHRRMRTTNQIHRRALSLFRSVAPRLGNWTTEEYDRVVRRVDSLYPTIGELWRAANEAPIRKL